MQLPRTMPRWLKFWARRFDVWNITVPTYRYLDDPYLWSMNWKIIVEWCIAVCVLSTSWNASGQVRQVSFGVFDAETKQPVADVHAFIGNATYGAVSNDLGEVQFDMSEVLSGEMILTHVSYDTKVLRYSQYNILTSADSIFITPNGIDLETILITQNRDRRWKKNFKKFKEAFLGTGRESSRCEILNPNVLRFKNEDGRFVATAVDMIQIKNGHLGYEVDFQLDSLTIDKNGSSKYVGYPQFRDLAFAGDSKFEKRRTKAYNQSTRHFFTHLIYDQLDEGKYKMRLLRYSGGEFTELAELEREDIVLLDSMSGLYHVRYTNFLEVSHGGIKELADLDHGIRVSKLESTRFSNNQDGGSSKLVHPQSMLYKRGPSLIVNRYGHIINHHQMEEYGFWARQRIAMQLPLDYAMEEVLDMADHTDSEEDSPSTMERFKDIIYGSDEDRSAALAQIDEDWNPNELPLVLDVMRLVDRTKYDKQVRSLLQKKTRQNNYSDGLRYLWQHIPVDAPGYLDVRAEIYKNIDPKFEKYFAGRENQVTINPNEIVWGGVVQDGIPPLRNPKMIAAGEASYLGDRDVVFGMYVNGEAKAYPKRILAWHEFFVDEIGGVSIAGVFCTLCNTMIGYQTDADGVDYDLGTSGFLYRSNKLMYDQATQSLWSTIEGKPVVGPLVGKGIELEVHPAVTTTWQEWTSMHPDTKVLSLETGHNRNYNEGEAYKSYYATDELMFPVLDIDSRLKNKDEVMIIRAEEYRQDPLAISTKKIQSKGLIQIMIGDQKIIVVSTKSGGARAYDSGALEFKSYKKGVLKDKSGNAWQVTEDALIGIDKSQLNRIPSHNAFWFAWYNAYPETRLIK